MIITGYCFSASLPPLLSAAATKALDQIDQHPEMLESLRERSSSLHQRICDSELTKFFTLKADEISPLKHLHVLDKFLSFSEQENILNNIVYYVSIYLSLVNFVLKFDNLYMKDNSPHFVPNTICVFTMVNKITDRYMYLSILVSFISC